MTATEPGASSRCTERASARCSRARSTARDCSVGSRSNSRRTTPSSKLRFCGSPASVNTLIILVLAGSTSAAKRRMPRSRATAAMCSRRAEATPRPWWASWTRKATSASSAGAEAGMPLRVDAVVADGGDELAADGGGEAHPVDVVVVGEAVHVAVGQSGVGGEEAVVLRLVRDLLVEADQPLGVVGGDGPDPRGAAVAQHHVGFPVGGVGVVRSDGVCMGPAYGSRGRARAGGRLRTSGEHGIGGPTDGPDADGAHPWHAHERLV